MTVQVAERTTEPVAEPNEHKWDLLLVVTSKRFGSERFATVQRLIDTALRHGYTVEVWACGYANLLTERSPIESEQSEAGCDGECCGGGEASGSPSREPSSAELIGDLVAGNADRFTWLACSTCSADRGVGEHIEGVPTPSFDQFRQYVENAAKTVYIGGA